VKLEADFRVDTRLMEEAPGAIRQALIEEHSDQEANRPQEPLPPNGSGELKEPQAGLLSPQRRTTVSSAVSSLMENVNKPEPTLEELIRDILRPILKTRLDENLPAVVERVVEAESGKK
jgi:cell pole-organizing protein PopZ